jgi:hypothetical protein
MDGIIWFEEGEGFRFSLNQSLEDIVVNLAHEDNELPSEVYSDSVVVYAL